MTRVPEAIDSHLAAGKHWRLGETPWRSGTVPPATMRVIVDNDFAGDPDDLYHLVHQLLSPAAEVRLVIGSHLRPGDPFDPSGDTAASAERVARDVFARMGLDSTDRIVQGAASALVDTETPQPSAAADAIIAEALRDDPRPLYYLAGGGLTDLASAYLLEPRIAERLILIWIGGLEHDGLAVPPVDAMPIEYNLLIDVDSARVLFAAGGLMIWQVPRDVYRQCLVSETELRLRIAAAGPLGQYLVDETAVVMDAAGSLSRGPGETYALGDSPLVLLSALQSFFEADTTSSFYVVKPTPQITPDGAYRQVSGARPMRVYTRVDVRLMFEDMFLKIDEFCRWQTRQ